MKKNKFLLNILVLALIITSFIACDSDFATLESDAINDGVATNFDILKNTYDVKAYNNILGPVQTNSFGLNTLGVYDDAYGRVTSSFVAQLTLSSYAPDFGEDVAVDSVVLNLPYYSAVTDVDEEGNITYVTDSIFGFEPIKLSLFKSKYFIRDFDPNAEFSESQAYFSDKSASENEDIDEDALEDVELSFLPNPNGDNHVSLNAQGDVIISNEGFILTQTEGEGDDEETVTTRQTPGIRLKLETDFWRTYIIEQQVSNPTVLSNQNNFTEYFRGLYFKAEPVNDDGSYLILNTSSTTANITIYYTNTTTNDDNETVEEQNSFALNFGGNKINFFTNDFNVSIPQDADTGNDKLYLKGGEGSIARIKLFNGDNVNDGDDQTFDDWKNAFVETDEDGKVKPKRLINEANLVFYVDQESLNMAMQDPEMEPNRLFLYDIDNERPLTDFFIDATNNSFPSFSKLSHLGPLQRVDDDPTQEGVKYKFRITEHLNNLLLRDSTNVELGLAVALNVNLEEQLIQQEVQETNATILSLPVTKVPISSILTPRGTILHGGTENVDADKRVVLEIYYTCPNGEDCD